MPAFASTGELITDALSGQYEIEREIGRGGMGVVYLARDLRLDRMVAIKTLPSSRANDAAIRERFLREARTAARLTHPSIVPIHRADELGGQVFFVMGFIDGDSLAAKLDAGPLSPRDALPILRDVTAALGYAHAHGVIHRDVKTENILLDSLSGRAVVTDFGIARMTEAAPLTATGQILGTVYYLSPEQVSGAAVDGRSDIYALGVVGYAMLSGRFPFDGPLASAVLVSHVTKQAVPMSIAAPHVPASLATIIDRCLAKDPAHRFQSCAELDAALAGAQTDAARVAVAAPRSKTPLISETEANAVFKRAAELQDVTGSQPRPQIAPQQRDVDADARRKSGFKTENLREAAVEAGIGEQYVEHALAERGLRPLPPTRSDRPDRRVTNIIHNLSAPGTYLSPEPTDIIYEMVVDGEAPEEDYDLLVEVIRRSAESTGIKGSAASVGRSLTWSGRSPRRRQLDVSVVPRNGKTVIRVAESLKPVLSSIYATLLGAGGVGLGGMLLGVAANNGAPLNGVLLAAAAFALSGLVAKTAADTLSQKRQQGLKQLLEALGAQARESIISSK